VETATALRGELGGGLFEAKRVPRARRRRAREAGAQGFRRRSQDHSPGRELARGDRAAGDREGAACDGSDQSDWSDNMLLPCAEGVRRGIRARPELRDTEQIPFLEAPPSGEPGGLPTEASAKQGIEAFIRREVLPYTPDAWIKEDATRIGYEISFTRHFYQPQPLRTLEEISADILAVEKEAEGLLDGLLKGGKA